jgi:hypothetical protein
MFENSSHTIHGSSQCACSWLRISLKAHLDAHAEVLLYGPFVLRGTLQDTQHSMYAVLVCNSLGPDEDQSMPSITYDVFSRYMIIIHTCMAYRA